ncbi:hypothetical protein MMC17_008514 [Xylographa soralifera]|nr:hypothetical protein [Xylographa soralifera]
MDHLTYPFGIEPNEEDAITYVSFNDYRGVQFLDYIKTIRPTNLPQTMVDARLTSLYASKLETSELERFLHTWLFFGLLQEVLDELFNQDDFLCVIHSKVVLSTKKLPGKLKQWMGDSSLDQKHLTHLQQCLKMTLIALNATPKIFDT